MNRKNYLFVVLAAAALLVAGAASAEPFNRYMTLQGALADVDGYDSGIGGVATYGVRVPEMHKNFSVEAELTKTFVEPEGRYLGSTWEVSYYTLAGYGVYSHPVTERFHLRGRAGLLYENVKVSSPASSKTEDDFKISFGLGFTLNLSNESRFILEYTVIDSDINHISAGMQFKM